MKNINKDIVKEVLERSGYEKLNPVQQLAVDNDLLLGENQVVAASTAAGKTLIAEMAALNTIRKGKKVVFIVPLKALATEKYSDFKKKYEPLGIKVSLSIGDYDSGDPWLNNADWVICTSEKFDSLLRHGIDWISDIGLVAVDEIHLLDSEHRGATLEMILTRLRQKISPDILGLSATISNYEELAEWLDARPVKSDWRPVKLYKGVHLGNRIDYHPDNTLILEEDSLDSIVENTLKKGKQALIFVSSRRNAESAAEKLGKIVAKHLTPKELQYLHEISRKSKGSLEKSSKQCQRLSKCMEMGTGFHHAGLLYSQRQLIEEAFKEGKLKIIAATPTLAWGVNLPAYRVIIRDLKRFSMGQGMSWIPVLDVEQMCGRAGRPQFDKNGEAVLIAKNERDAEFIWENYILGESEKINSQLGAVPILRTHVLAIIAGDVVSSRKELSDFFSYSFYAHQSKDTYALEESLDEILDKLEDFQFIKKENTLEGERLSATKIGKRVAQLYIDPVSANHLIQNLVESQGKKEMTSFAWIHILLGCLEMYPLLRINKKDWKWIEKTLIMEEAGLLQEPPQSYEFEYEDFLQTVKTAQLFNEWMDERGEDLLLEKFGITPGELKMRLETIDWLLYSAMEFVKLTPNFKWGNEIRKIRTRMHYGVKEELLPLIRVKGIGRVRARRLFDKGIKSTKELREVTISDLSKILGPKVANNIKDQLFKK